MCELSCYTTALHRYLSDEWDADPILVPGIRLAVGTKGPDRLAFSHHQPSVDRLPDGTVLRYAGAATRDDALDGLLSALDRHGRVVVQVDLARLAWSPRWSGGATPHWLVVDGRSSAHWQVHDPFDAALIDGAHPPYRGSMTEAELCAALFTHAWPPAQRRRAAMAFGHRAAIPDKPAVWLERSAGHQVAAASDPDGWLVELDDVLTFLADQVAHDPSCIQNIHDDLWAAARHRVYALRNADAAGACCHDAVSQVIASWAALPRATYVAIETSRRRGGARVSTVLTVLRSIRESEEALRQCR
ncbi:hypothetical protein [Streptomyces sp. 7N604]|uniref:hypothetical protein n=1 Tax=Streptomyces sp. 7N604 TaxID=3457415 RepID=UPI003FD385C8